MSTETTPGATKTSSSAPANHAGVNPGFGKFMAGLVLGLVVGLVAGAVLPAMLGLGGSAMGGGTTAGDGSAGATAPKPKPKGAVLPDEPLDQDRHPKPADGTTPPVPAPAPGDLPKPTDPAKPVTPPASPTAPPPKR